MPQTGTLVYAGDPPHVHEGVSIGRQYGRFVYTEDAPSRWTKTDQVILHGYWSWDWFDEFVMIDRIDPAKKEIWPFESGSRYGYTKNQQFYAMNILEELDQPGEWYLDREDRLLDEPMLVMVSTVNVWVHSITFEHSRSSAIEINGVGKYVANNLIHDAPHTSILFNGTENIIEFNELHSLALQTGDVGAFYIGRDWTQRGNVIHHNYFHDLKDPGLHVVMAVYLDDWASGTIIYGNIFYRSGRSVFVGSGRDNLIADPVIATWERSVGAPQEVYANGDTLIARELDGNVIMQGNPGFMDLKKLDFRLRSDSKAFEMGFKAIPVERIGLIRQRSSSSEHRAN